MIMKKRLSKILAENNIASRRKAEELIFDKKVKVNNTLVTKPQFLADIETDRIEVNGKILKPLSKKIYYIINKPKGYVCSCKRITNEKIILDLFPTEKRLFPVGRLDKDTTGLLIITNDGHFAQKIIHPSFDIEKEYLVKVNKFITHDDLVLLSKGIYIDKTFTKPTKVIKVRKNTLKITVKEGKKHDQHWMLANLPSDGSVQMEDLTYKMGCLVLVGPESRKVLEKIVYGDVSSAAFKFSTSRQIYVGRTKCRINRMNYVGELGFEIFHPIEQQIALYHALMEAGKDFDLKLIGMHAMDSMRLEKGYLAWKSEMNVHHTPLETNVAWTVKLDKEFIGKQGILKQKEKGVPLKLVCMVVDAKDSDPWGYNPIFKDGHRIGMTSSGGYGHRVEKSIALGYITPEFAVPGTKMDVEILGRARKAQVVTMPLYDPENKKIKC